MSTDDQADYRRRREIRRERRTRSLLGRLEVRAFLFLQRWIGRRQPGTAYRLIETLVLLAFYFMPRLRQRSLESLAIAYPDRPLAWRRHIMWESARHLAWTLADYLRLPYLFTPERLRQIDVEQALALFHDLGVGPGTPGVLVFGGHMGNGDLLSTVVAHHLRPHGVELLIAARQMDNIRIEEILDADRCAHGRVSVGKVGFVHRALETLAGGGVVGVMLDQDAGRSRGIFVPYFGRLASTPAGAAVIAQRSGSPCVGMLPLRTRRRRLGYRCDIVGPIDLPTSGDPARDIVDWTARMTAVIEDFARQHPEQCLWVHRRWKSRPTGERVT